MNHKTSSQWGGVLNLSLLGSFIAVLLSWGGYIHLEDGISLSEIFNDKNLKYTLKFTRSLLGVGEELPAFLNIDKWRIALELSFETLQMSILSIFLAGLFAVLLAIPAARIRGTTRNKVLNGFSTCVFAMLRIILLQHVLFLS